MSRFLAFAPLVVVLAACAAAPPKPQPTPQAAANGAREALLAFLTEAESGHFDACYRELAASLRARYTPDRLASDYREAGQSAKDRIARARVAADVPPTGDETHAAFPIGEGKAVQLEREDGVWRITSLE